MQPKEGQSYNQLKLIDGSRGGEQSTIKDPTQSLVAKKIEEIKSLQERVKALRQKALVESKTHGENNV